jgi:A/G-specific adenine glycosylase
MADAVLAFAYGKDVAVVDANVCRILERVFGLEARGEARRDPRFRRIVQEIVPKGRAKEFNWAMIDFAALICTPRSPGCPKCPVREMCRYRKKHSQQAYSGS